MVSEMKKVLIFGGASAIAHQTAINFAKDGAELYLIDIKVSRVDAVADDIKTKVPNTIIHTAELDALNYDLHQQTFDEAVKTLGGLDAFLIAHGTLPKQEEIEKDTNAIIREFNINALSGMSLATIAANYFEEKGSGSIAIISSVAGDRGRKSNYVYGSAKAALSAFTTGLRGRLASKGINVLTVKPGFVDTPMTADMPKNPLYSSPQQIGKGIFEAITKGKDVVYLPGFWKLIMMIVKAVPEGIFKKLNF